MSKSKKIVIEDRKAFLDNIMKEYYYEKNSVDETLEFLAHMFNEYEKLIDGWEA